MRFNIRIVSVVIFVLFSEAVISYFVVKQIPAEMIMREPFNSFKSLFSFSLIFKFLPFIILSLILSLFSLRYNSRSLSFAAIFGFVGLLIPWLHLLSQLSESWVTSLKISSTFGLSYLALLIVVPTGLAGIFIGISAALLWSYFNRSGTIECYEDSKSGRTYLAEGSVLLILGAVIALGFYILSHPYILEDKASSVRTSQRELELYYLKAKEESNSGLLSSLAANPKLPVPMIEEIYNMASALGASHNMQCMNLYSALSQNIKTPDYILSSISDLNNSSINYCVALNPNTSEATLINLAKQGTGAVKIAVSRNPKTPVEVLTLLSGESHYVIRRFVARHKNVTKEILMDLTNDKDERVKSVALKEIERFQK